MNYYRATAGMSDCAKFLMYNFMSGNQMTFLVVFVGVHRICVTLQILNTSTQNLKYMLFAHCPVDIDRNSGLRIDARIDQSREKRMCLTGP